mmetsp:Transcript_29841/g.67513  ORF Transcript_29841/g.67513 Transcript_29841/m.67513 type:complete len:207 (+) Transcript_29841:117-737(+)
MLTTSLTVFKTVLISVLTPSLSLGGEETKREPFTVPSSLSWRGVRVGSMTTLVSGDRFPFSSSHFLIAHRSYTLPSVALTGSLILSKVRGHSPQSFCRFFPGVLFLISDGFSSAFPCRILTSSPDKDWRMAASCSLQGMLLGERNWPLPFLDPSCSAFLQLRSPPGLLLRPLGSSARREAELLIFNPPALLILFAPLTSPGKQDAS